MSAPKRRFILHSSFSSRLTENLHKQKHFSKYDLHVLFISFFSEMYNKKNIYHSTIPVRSSLVRRRMLDMDPYGGTDTLGMFHLFLLLLLIIIIKKGRQCKAARGRLTPYQSEDPSPTLPTYSGKEEKGKIVEDKKGESN